MVFRRKRRKNFRRIRGHRQDLTLIQITDIATDGKLKPAAKKAETAKPAAKKAATAKPAAKKSHNFGKASGYEKACGSKKAS